MGYTLGQLVWYHEEGDLTGQAAMIAGTSGQLYKGTDSYSVQIESTNQLIDNVLHASLRPRDIGEVIPVKLYATVYTPQDLEYAASAGAEGFGHVADLDDSEHYAFSKNLLDSDVIEKLADIVKDGWSTGDKFKVGEAWYQLD